MSNRLRTGWHDSKSTTNRKHLRVITALMLGGYCAVPFDGLALRILKVGVLYPLKRGAR